MDSDSVSLLHLVLVFEKQDCVVVCLFVGCKTKNLYLYAFFLGGEIS